MDSGSEAEIFEDALDHLTKPELYPSDENKSSVEDTSPVQLNCDNTRARNGKDNQNHKLDQNEFGILKNQDSDSDDSEFSADENNSSHSNIVTKDGGKLKQISDQKETDFSVSTGFVTETSDLSKEMRELGKKLIGLNTADSVNSIETSQNTADNVSHYPKGKDDPILSSCNQCGKSSCSSCSDNSHGSDSFSGQYGDKKSSTMSSKQQPSTDSDYQSKKESQRVKVEESPEWDEETKKESETGAKGDAGQDNVEIEEELMREQEASMSEDEKEVRKEEAQVLKADGNSKFKEQDYTGAIELYTQALHTCPTCYVKERSIMYSNRAACRFKLKDHELASKDCSKALELNSNYLKALLRRAECYEKMEKLEDALEDYQKALSMDPSLINAREACMRLPDQIKDRNEKMKTEMLCKLKELGNMVLKPFGLSTENFKLNQDPSTGSYSVNFQQQQQGQQQQSQPRDGPNS